MSEREDELDPLLARALDALPEERPDRAFQAELRARFVGAAAEQDEDVDVAPVRRRRPAPAPRRAPWLGLAAAAALLVALGLWWTQRADAPQPWRVEAADASATLDGLPLDAARLAAGGRLRTGPEGGLRLVLGSHMALSVGPDSDLVVPAVTTLEGPQDWLLEAAAGHLAVATGPAFPGSRLAVRAPDVEVEVVGTRFAVDVYEEGTCVCCDEGRVRVTSRRAGEEGAQVDPGGMAYAHVEGGLSQGDVMPDHLAPLEELEGIFE